MAVTQNQQYLADVAQAGDADQCCIALGGDLVIDSDGTPLCSFPDYEYPRSQSCQYAAGVSMGSPTQGGSASGGGLGGWLSNNLGVIADSASTIIGALNPTPPPPPSEVTMPGNTAQYNTKRIITAVLVLAGVVGIVLFIRKKK
jgi:hypothetical protein